MAVPESSRARSASPGLESEIDSSLAEVRPPEGAVIVIVNGEQAGRVYALGRLDRILGRDPVADVFIDEPAISQRHARIFVQNGRYGIEDLGSTNGTFVNGERVRSGIMLHRGDVLRVGETELQYLVPPKDGGPAATILLHDPPGDRASGEVRRRRVPAVGGAPPDEPTFQDLVIRLVTAYRFVYRNRKALVVFACAGALIGGMTILVRPPKATAGFELRLKQVETPNPIRPFDKNVVDVSSSTQRHFLAPPLVERTLEQLDGVEPSSDHVKSALQSLALEGMGPRAYHGTFDHSSPERARAFLSVHLERFIAAEVDGMVEVARAEAAFLRGQLEQNEAELRKTEAELSAFKREHLEGLPDQARQQFESLIELRTRETSLVSLVERTRAELDLAKQRVKSDEATLERRVESTQPYRDAIVEARRKLGAARARGLAEEHPDVVKLRREVDELERLNESALGEDISELERRATRGIRALRDDVAELGIKLSAAEKELGHVRGQIAKAEKVVEKLPEVEERFAGLNRSYGALQELHSKLFQQLKAAEVKLEFERASAVARYDATPVDVVTPSVRKAGVLRASAGAVLGLIIALAIAGAIEFRRYVKRLAI